MPDDQLFPVLRQVVLDTTDPRGLAEFYRKLLGYVYRDGDELPDAGQADEKGGDWLVLHHPDGAPRLAFQQASDARRSTWPTARVPAQLHLDLVVPTIGDLWLQHERALGLGATVLLDRTDDEDEPLLVYADPAGHPFCIFVSVP